MPYQLHPYSNRWTISAGQLPLSDSRLFQMDDKSKLLVVLFWRRLSYSTELRTIAYLIWAPQSQSPEHVWILFVERTKKTLRMMIAIIKQTAGDRQKNSVWRDSIIASTRQYYIRWQLLRLGIQTFPNHHSIRPWFDISIYSSSRHTDTHSHLFLYW